MNAHLSPEVPFLQRPEGRLRADVLNRMHSRGHDLSRTRCRAFPAEAASPSCPSTFFPTCEINFLSLSHRRFRVGEGYRRSPEQRRAQDGWIMLHGYLFCQVTASSARVAGHGDLAEAL